MAMFGSTLDYYISLVLQNEEKATSILSYIFLFWGFSVLISLQTVTAPYGRYARSGWGLAVPVKFAWIVQEFPSFAVPLFVAFYSECPKESNVLNRFALGLFLFHYFQRTFIFPMLIRGGKPTPMVPFVMAIFFCMLNGYLQSTHLLKFADLGQSPLSYLRVAAGACVFLTGMTINIHSDHVLRNLRKPGETNYKIPVGGMFEYVSGANFLGEVLEWWGFALVCCSLPSLAFAVFTICNIGPRACQHHRWYQEKFDDYPKNRKALIPFVL
ncbi:3-oxo-5-alpha-steroid 4-dehydrogenase 1 [Aplysia californica]|uniref:3-oxo-5alpha-steroid 4-dehydrogenase (NADP(+)) n=1 Tax=Aplysia californica TaxID=6500 RepID=A0ABM0ZXY8_APLCA|nr:3-oxo-5-alpha-steroid 4-dehydrogenase 1 [Aplysia californica]